MSGTPCWKGEQIMDTTRAEFIVKMCPANFDEALKAMDDSYEALRESLCDIAAGTQKKDLAGSTIRDFNMVYKIGGCR